MRTVLGPQPRNKTPRSKAQFDDAIALGGGVLLGDLSLTMFDADHEAAAADIANQLEFFEASRTCAADVIADFGGVGEKMFFLDRHRAWPGRRRCRRDCRRRWKRGSRDPVHNFGAG